MLSEQIPNPSPHLALVSGGRLRAGCGGGWGRTAAFPRICLQGIAYAHRLRNWRAPEDTSLHLFAGAGERRPKPDPPGKSSQGPGPAPRLCGPRAQKSRGLQWQPLAASCKHRSAAALPRRSGRGGGGETGVPGRARHSLPPTIDLRTAVLRLLPVLS